MRLRLVNVWETLVCIYYIYGDRLIDRPINQNICFYILTSLLSIHIYLPTLL